MKKKDLASLALLGLASGMLVSCQQTGMDKNDKNGNGSRMEQTQMTPAEKDFYNKLDKDGQRKFEKMNERQRDAAMDAHKAGCKGKNDCKGMGGCKTNAHDCKGENSCRGRGGCAVDDANEAVDMAEKKMQNKRNNMRR